jgi:uridine phosphorylase
MPEPLANAVEEEARAALLAGDPERAQALARAAIDAGQGTVAVWALLVRATRDQGRH